MDVAHAVVVVAGSLLAVVGLVIATKPDGKAILDKLAPYQAVIGVAMVLLGVINLARAIPYLTSAFRVNAFYAAVVLTLLGVSILLGALFGIPQIATWIPGPSPAEQKARALSQKVAPYQGILGVAGLASALIYLLYRFNVVHWHA